MSTNRFKNAMSKVYKILKLSGNNTSSNEAKAAQNKAKDITTKYVKQLSTKQIRELKKSRELYDVEITYYTGFKFKFRMTELEIAYQIMNKKVINIDFINGGR